MRRAASEISSVFVNLLSSFLNEALENEDGEIKDCEAQLSMGRMFMSVIMLMIYCNNKSKEPHSLCNLLQQYASRARPPGIELQT